MNALERARGLFQANLASDHEALTPFYESLAQRIAMAVDLATDGGTQVQNRLPRTKVAFTVQCAVGLASKVRPILSLAETDPLFDLAALVGNKLHVFVFPVPQESIRSGCALLDNIPLIFVSNKLGFEQLRVIAAELGRLIANTSRMRVSNFAFIRPARPSSQQLGPKDYFYSNFGTELLVPTSAFATALSRVRALIKVTSARVGDIEMLYLARIFGVAFEDIARKCERLGLIPVGGALALQRYISERFEGPEQRATGLGLPDRPEIRIAQIPAPLVERLRRNGTRIAPRAISAALDIDETEFARLIAGEDLSLEGLWQ